MPVRIEERVNRTAAGQAGDGFHTWRPNRGGSTIDEQHSLGAGLRDDVGFAGNPQDEKVVAQPQRAIRRALSLGLAKSQERFAENDPGARQLQPSIFVYEFEAD